MKSMLAKIERLQFFVRDPDTCWIDLTIFDRRDG